MNLSLEQRMELMARLGRYFLSEDPELAAAKERACQKNGWFIPRFVDTALRQIALQFLDPARLAAWTDGYPALRQDTRAVDVGIVMAGNIPAVGFHDFLCAFISGHDMSLKLSSRDDVLLGHFIAKLLDWEPALAGHIRIRDMLRGCDAYIATGSGNSARYFHYYFGKYPHIIRRNRTSAAVLDGTEEAAELERLSDDIFLYFGLGCRNVTILQVPEDYDFGELLQAFKRYAFLRDHHRYANNFDYNLSIALLNNTSFLDGGTVLLEENASVFSPIGVLHYQRYGSRAEADQLLGGNPDIQCVAGHGHIAFGTTQAPALTDYADVVDTLGFLSSLGENTAGRPG
jgi:hypothetical protein